MRSLTKLFVDQGREFENKIMQELCLFCGSHKTRTTPYHPESDGMVECFNRTLLMMLAMFAGKNRDDWYDLLPAVMMAYRSSVHESTGFSPYRLMFGEECTLPMDIGLPKEQLDTPDSITSPGEGLCFPAYDVQHGRPRSSGGRAWCPVKPSPLPGMAGCSRFGLVTGNESRPMV